MGDTFPFFKKFDVMGNDSILFGFMQGTFDFRNIG